MFKLFSLLRQVLSVRTSTAALPLGGYGAMTQYGADDTSTIVFGALILTIFMQLHRAWFVYNPLIDEACTDRKLQTGQLIAFSFSATIVVAVLLAFAHYHMLAEMVIAVQQCALIAILVWAWFGNLKIRGKFVHHLATEIMHVIVLVWLMMATVQGPWNDNKIVEFSLVVIAVVAASHYVLHLIFAEIRNAQPA